MKTKTYKTLLAVVVFVALGLFTLNPAFAVSDCNLVCEGSFVIDVNDAVGDLAALSGCTSVTGSLSINYSPLTSLEGLECLTHVGGLLDIYKNPSLTSLAALDNITSVGGDLRIRRNYELCTSLAEALRDQVLDAGGIGGSTNISDNRPGC
jgi:hypothetical protein